MFWRKWQQLSGRLLAWWVLVLMVIGVAKAV